MTNPSDVAADYTPFAAYGPSHWSVLILLGAVSPCW